MSYTEIYKFKKNGDSEFIGETQNAFRGAMAIWSIIEERYLPKQRFPRVNDTTEIKEVWKLYESEEISEVDKLVLATTFDRVIVKKEHIPLVLDAMRKFEGSTTLKEQADIIEDTYKNDEDLIAIAWNQTSVNHGYWESDTSILHSELEKDHPLYEEDYADDEEYEVYPPYNIFKEDKHYEIFD